MPDLRVLDSITEAVAGGAGAVVVSGSHGGVSSGRYALQALPLAVVFNDAGIGRDQAGIAALAMLQSAGIAACAMAHTSARIGDALSSLSTGEISRANDAAQTLGARVGMSCRDWVDSLMRPATTSED